MCNKSRGLTLVELLVAITILGLIAAIGWRGLDSIVRSRAALNADLEQTRGMQLAFAQLQSDCAQLASPANLPDHVAVDAPPNKLTLIRKVFAENQPSRLQVISYRVLNGTLTRRESLPTRDLDELDKFWRAALNDSDNNPPVSLQTGVADMALRLWLNAVWQTGSNAAVLTNIGNGVAPSGLEVTLTLSNQAQSLVKIFLLGAV
jgi:general secretion pathway protein J